MKTKHVIIILLALILAALILILIKPEIGLFKFREPEKSEDCSGRPYYTDAMHLRASGRGQSVDANTARRMALMNARTFLAEHQGELVTEVLMDYMMERDDTDEEMLHRYNKIGNHFGGSVTSAVICEHETQLENGAFLIKVVIEATGSTLFEQLDRHMRLDEVIVSSYDRELLEKIFYKTLRDFAGL